MRPGSSTLALLLAATLLLPAAACNADQSDSRSVEWVSKHEHDRVERLFAALDYSRPGLEPVRAASAAKDYPRACTALIDYYRNAGTAPWLRLKTPVATEKRDFDSDSLLVDRLTVYSTHGRIQRKSGGGIDWKSRGPRNDPEWGNALNAMYRFDTLLHGYTTTGRREYATRIDAELRDWILSNPVPDGMADGGPWRGMDAASRARNWMRVFYRLQDEKEFSPAARILLLSSILDHAEYLRRFHHTDSTNRCVMEMQGLGTIGCAWPEFHLASMWRSFASDQMTAEMKAQVYPDGVHTELSASYHRVVVELFNTFNDMFRQFGYDAPASLTAGVIEMWNYLALSLRPDGTTPENNDSDRRDMRDQLNKAAQEFDRPDWAYVTSNGASGAPPATGPSVMFPWAGQLIIRSGWEKDAQWAFFDIGPEGTAHQHRDKLHLSIDAFGRAVLVDAGRYSYSNDAWRAYFTGTAAHNSILIDGRGQKNEAFRATAPISPDDFVIAPQYDFARGTFTGGYDDVPGKITHTRAVLYVKNEFWVVVDHIEADAPHDVEALWHFAPDCHVRIDGNDVLSDDADKGNVRIVPVGGPAWETALVSGQSALSIQGWYSPIFGDKQPETCALFHATVPGITFAWLLVPARGVPDKLDARVVSSTGDAIALRVAGYDIRIPMSAGRPEVIKAAKK